MDPVTLRGKLPDGAALLLRPHREDDIDAVLAQCTDPEMVRWTTIPQPYARAHAEQFVREIQPAGWRTGTSCGWALEVDGAFAGTLDLRLHPARAAEVGFGVGPWARGRGVVPEALRLACRWGFDVLGLEVVHWQAFVGNWASRRAAWKAGFRVEGTVRSLLSARDQRYDAWVGSLRHGDPMSPPHRWLQAEPLPAGPVQLRAWRDTDAAGIVEACSDPVTRHWLAALPSPYGVAEARDYLHSCAEAHASGGGVFWCLADRNDRCVGSIAVMDLLHGAPDTAEVGYWLHPAARGRGLMSAALRAVAAHALHPEPDGGLGLRRLTLCAADGNTASQRVAERADFRCTGRQRAAERLGDGTYADLMAYDLLAGELR